MNTNDIELTDLRNLAVCLTLPQTSPGFTCLQYKSPENTKGKIEIDHNEQFLLFPQCFLPVWRTFYLFHRVQNCRLQTLSVWNSLKFVDLERVNMKLHTTKSKQKQFYRIDTESSSWKISNVTIATFWIYMGNISIM